MEAGGCLHSSALSCLCVSLRLGRHAAVTYCSVVQEHLLESQEIRECEQHVKDVASHFILMVPAKDRVVGFVSEQPPFMHGPGRVGNGYQHLGGGGRSIGV